MQVLENGDETGHEKKPWAYGHRALPSGNTTGKQWAGRRGLSLLFC